MPLGFTRGLELWLTLSCSGRVLATRGYTPLSDVCTSQSLQAPVRLMMNKIDRNVLAEHRKRKSPIKAAIKAHGESGYLRVKHAPTDVVRCNRSTYQPFYFWNTRVTRKPMLNSQAPQIRCGSRRASLWYSSGSRKHRKHWKW